MALKKKGGSSFADALGIPKAYQRNDDAGMQDSPAEESSEDTGMQDTESIIANIRDLLDQLEQSLQSEENAEDQSQAEY